MNKHRSSFIILLLVCLFLTVPTPKAEAVVIDVCKWVLKKTLIPATYRDIVSCDYGWSCALDAQCCTPVLCNTLPHCVSTETVIDVAAHYEDTWQLQCDPTDLDPKEEFYKWLRQQIPSLDDALLPGAFETARIDINAMRLAATSIPSPIKNQIRDLISQFTQSGTAKFSNSEIDSAKILSNSNSNASLYLRDGFGGITLKDLIIIRNTHFDALMNSTNQNLTASQIMSGNAPSEYVEALLLLIHELVHVKQYADIGSDAFVTQYLMQAVAKGYKSIHEENEARKFELAVAGQITGDQSVEIESVRILASKFRISQAAVRNDLAKWKNIQRWFKRCISGNEMSRGAAIPKKHCIPEAEIKFNLNGERARYPLIKSPKLPSESVTQPDGKKVIVPPKPIATPRPIDPTRPGAIPR